MADLVRNKSGSIEWLIVSSSELQSDAFLEAAVGEYGSSSMRGQMARHCLDLRRALRAIVNHSPPPRQPTTTMLEEAVEMARELIGRIPQ